MAAHFDAKQFAGSIDQSLLATELQKSLRQTVFSSGLGLSPRRVNQISQAVADNFVSFCADAGLTDPSALGRSLALEGLGPHSVLTTTENLRRVCRSTSTEAVELFEIAGSFVNSLLEGYMHGREERLLEIQERTHRAHLAALARLQEESNRQD